MEVVPIIVDRLCPIPKHLQNRVEIKVKTETVQSMRSQNYVILKALEI